MLFTQPKYPFERTHDTFVAFATEFDLGPELILNGHPFWYLETPSNGRYHIRLKRHTIGAPWKIVNDLGEMLSRSGCWIVPQGPGEFQSCWFGDVMDAVGYYYSWQDRVASWLRGELANLDAKQLYWYNMCPYDLSY